MTKVIDYWHKHLLTDMVLLFHF
uniref:1 4-alpha-glucan-branching enzyme 3ic/amyloplastic isoform X2 n=1 Tax=Rhizophora mucronata TaxID=61149 RepID=A0A2P2LZE6_RHIMU